MYNVLYEKANTPYEQEMYNAVETQNIHKLHGLLTNRDANFNINKEYSEYDQKPLLFGHLTRSYSEPNPRITLLLIKQGFADVNYHKFNLRCCAVYDALPWNGSNVPEDDMIDDWNGRFEKDPFMSRYDNLRIVVWAGADVNIDGFSHPALHSAASVDDKIAVRFLIHNGADVSQVDQTGKTPLCMASTPIRGNGDPDPVVIELLLRSGADPYTRFESRKLSCAAICAGSARCNYAFKLARVRLVTHAHGSMSETLWDDPEVDKSLLWNQLEEIKKLAELELFQYHTYQETRSLARDIYDYASADKSDPDQ
jgi:hypothetical protein